LSKLGGVPDYVNSADRQAYGTMIKYYTGVNINTSKVIETRRTEYRCGNCRKKVKMLWGEGDCYNCGYHNQKGCSSS